MSGNFTTEEFIRQLQNGDFDGRLNEEIRRLSDAELEQVALALRQSLNSAAGA